MKDDVIQRRTWKRRREWWQFFFISRPIKKWMLESDGQRRVCTEATSLPTLSKPRSTSYTSPKQSVYRLGMHKIRSSGSSKQSVNRHKILLEAVSQIAHWLQQLVLLTNWQKIEKNWNTIDCFSLALNRASGFSRDISPSEPTPPPSSLPTPSSSSEILSRTSIVCRNFNTTYDYSSDPVLLLLFLLLITSCWLPMEYDFWQR